MLTRTDGRTDGRTDMTKQIVDFRNFVNAPKIIYKNEHNVKKVARPVGRPRRGWQGRIKMDPEEILSRMRTVFSRVSMGANGKLVLIQ